MIQEPQLTPPRILISGAGIAGLALGYWLAQKGIRPVVIDRAPRFQALGHYISLKGKGVEVIRQMGLEPACRARAFAYSQVKNFSAGGTLLRVQGSPSELDGQLGGYIMLRRSDLAEALFEAVRDRVDLRYATQINAIHEAGVELSTGEIESFDFVFGADGIHSRTRRLVFGEGFEHSLGGHYFGLTQSYAHGLTPGDVRMYFGRGQSAMLMPTSESCVSAVFYHGSGGRQPTAQDTPSLRRFLLEAYRDFAPEVRGVVDALDEQAFVFMDVIAQVRMPSIVKGRVALLGDAAHCPTFMSGMGSSLALQGARLLASNLEDLFAYEAAIRPIADRYQGSALQMRTMLLDRRPWVSFVRNMALRIMPDWVMDRAARKFIAQEISPPSNAQAAR